MRNYKLGELILDYAVYPRTSTDPVHVNYLAQALNAGSELPPPVIDKKSKRVVDGFHRVTLYRRLYEGDHEIECVERSYKSDGDLFADAMRMNAAHGRILHSNDRVHCLIVAEQLHLSIQETAKALGMTEERLSELREDRLATLTVPGKSRLYIPLKATIRHMRGRALTEEQVAANEKLSGMNQLFYVNQVITLIENGLLEEGNDELMQRLQHLAGLVKKLKVAA